jgi:hypothetical protein
MSGGEKVSVAEAETLSVAVIRQDGGTQARAEIDQSTVESYRQSMDDGIAFPAITVFHDGADYWLADGFHRLAAIIGRGVKYASCCVKSGTREDAILYAAGANKMHGLRRTNADKRRAVEMLLACEKWAGRSDVWLAQQTGVSDKTVATVRRNLGSSEVAPRTGQDGKTRRLPAAKTMPAPAAEVEIVIPVVVDDADMAYDSNGDADPRWNTRSDIAFEVQTPEWYVSLSHRGGIEGKTKAEKSEKRAQLEAQREIDRKRGYDQTTAFCIRNLSGLDSIQFAFVLPYLERMIAAHKGKVKS